MSLFPKMLPLLFAAGVVLDACTDRGRSANPTAPISRELAPALANAEEPIVVVGTGDPAVENATPTATIGGSNTGLSGPTVITF